MGLVPSGHIRELRLCFLVFMADRGIHRGAVYRGAISAAPAPYVHRRPRKVNRHDSRRVRPAHTLLHFSHQRNGPRRGE